MFIHGNGNGRRSESSRRSARILHGHGLATLLIDLMTDVEASDWQGAGDVDLLAWRVAQVLDWLAEPDALSATSCRLAPTVGLFGAGTGAAVALAAAAMRSGRVGAVVSRGGRVDQAADALDKVDAPTMLIVGAEDRALLADSRVALRHLPGARRLEIVPGASHLFVEPGALETMSELAAQWFAEHLPARR